MCGIAALITLPCGLITLPMIQAMTNAAAHRGPDGEGFLAIKQDKKTAIAFGGTATQACIYSSKLPFSPSLNAIHSLHPNEICILLGHRRLAITDLSPRGHQPMCLADQKIWITYNGEIYNAAEIRQELIAAGYSFISHSDTEVILAAYDAWGVDCLHRFNGMFAFVLIDLKKPRLFAARDRFGVKPLYYWKSSAGFLAFASEIKQFTALPSWAPQVNPSRAVDYLTDGLSDFSQETLFAHVFQMQAGHFIESSLELSDIPKTTKWYELKKKPLFLSFEEAASSFQTLFEDAVSLRMQTDVNLGSCLSGGLDSSAIVCMMDRLLNKSSSKQTTFSANSHIAALDEGRYINEVLSQTKAQGHFVTPTLQGLLPTIKELTWHQDEPFGSSSIYAQYLVFELAKKANIKVMLDGQGADELLAGYPSFWAAHFAGLLKKGRFLAYKQEKDEAYTTGSLLTFSTQSLLKSLLPQKAKTFFKTWVNQSPSLHPFFPWINLNHISYQKPAYRSPHFSDLVDNLSFESMSKTSLPALLRYEDRNSMAHSIEARTPFLDYRLVEFLFSLPSSYKIGNGYTKKVLREALPLLPQKIRWRTDKIGFATAEQVWMCTEDPKRFLQEVRDAIDKSQGFINTRANTLAARMIDKKIPFDWTLWRIINFGYWMEVFQVQS